MKVQCHILLHGAKFDCFCGKSNLGFYSFANKTVELKLKYRGVNRLPSFLL